MVKDVTEAFLFKFDRDSLTCEFPAIVSDLVGTDTNFEIVSSGTLQTLKIFYEHNFVKKSAAVIFVAPTI